MTSTITAGVGRLRRSLQPRTEALETAAAVSFGLFLLAGSFKEATLVAWFPIDLTLMLLAATGVAALGLLVVDTGRLRHLATAAPIVVLFVVFLFGIPGAEPGYGYAKVWRLFSITLVAGLGPFVIAATPRTRSILFRTMVIVGVVMAVVGIVAYMFADPKPRRLRVPGSNVPALGRTTGLAFIAFLASPIAMFGRRGRLVLGALLAAGLVFSGSLAPIVGAILGVGVLGLRGVFKLEWRTALGATAFLGVVLTLLVLVGPIDSAGRLIQFASGDPGESGSARIEALSGSVDVIADNPGGIGWGEFSAEVDVEVWEGLERQYPHNIVAETTLEAGWLAGVVLIGVVVIAFQRIFAAGRGDRSIDTLLGVLVLSLAIAMFSGDVNDNRVLFAVIGVALSVRNPVSTPS